MDEEQYPIHRSRRPRYIDFVPVSRPQNPAPVERKPLQIKVTTAETSTTPTRSSVQTVSEYTETTTILYPPVQSAKTRRSRSKPSSTIDEDILDSFLSTDSSTDFSEPSSADDSVELGIIEDVPRAKSPTKSHLSEQPTPKSASSSNVDHAAPDANRYTLGGKSPFINTTQVDKRPLSNHVPENSSHNLNSSKNIYSRHTVLKDDDQKTVPTIVKSKKKDHSGIGLVVAIILTLIVGGFVGAVAYLAFFQ